VHDEVLLLVREGHRALREHVARRPVLGERDARVVLDRRVRDLVLRLPRVLVRADGVAAVALVGDRRHVLGVGGAVDVEAVAVVGGHEDEGVVEDAERRQLLDGGLDGVVELEQLTERAVVVQRVHLLVDRRRLCHHEEAALAAALMQDVDGLKDHLLKAGEVGGSRLVAAGVVLGAGDVRGVDVAVEPGGEVGGAEEAEGALGVLERGERGVVLRELVPLLLELGDVIQALIGTRAGDEVLGAGAHDDVGAVEGRPGVVGDAVEHLVDERPVVAAGAGVACQGNWGGISKEGGGDDADGGAPDTSQQLDDGLDLWIIEGVGGGVGVDAHGVDGALVAAVDGGGGVGGVGEVGVHGVGHLVTDDGERVHGHLGLVLAVDGLVSDQTGGRDHGGGHAVTDEEDDVLGLLLLGEVADDPVGDRLGAVVVFQSRRVLAWLVERDAAVGLGGNVDMGGGLRILGEEVLIPLELPGLERWLGDAEESADWLSSSTCLLDGEGEVLVWDTAVGCSQVSYKWQGRGADAQHLWTYPRSH